MRYSIINYHPVCSKMSNSAGPSSLPGKMSGLAIKVLVKELQALALDIRVLDQNGEEIQLSTLCNDDDGSTFANKADRAAIDEALGDDKLQMGDLRDAFTFEDEDGEAIEDDEEYFDEFESESDDYYDGEE